MKRRIRVLNPNSAWKAGHHVLAAIELVREMHLAGADIHLHLIRSLIDMTDVPNTATVSRLLRKRGMSWLEDSRRAKTQQNYLDALQPNDIAWLWPTVAIETYREVAKRGNPILMEGINTRIAYSRRILFDTYQREGLTRGSLDEMVAQEEEMLSLASYFFSPSPLVTEALLEQGSSFHGQVLETSYAAEMPDTPNQTRKNTDNVVVLFIGEDSLRKNVHGLLRAWKKIDPKNATLRLVGQIDPQVQELCEAELQMESVETLGYVQNLHAVYRDSDVFIMPSFEEGSPRVTYQAAGYGLPVIASPMGAGRLADRNGVIAKVDPFDVDSIAETLDRFINNADLRDEYGKRSAGISPDYTWRSVGRDRFAQLCEIFGAQNIQQVSN